MVRPSSPMVAVRAAVSTPAANHHSSSAECLCNIRCCLQSSLGCFPGPYNRYPWPRERDLHLTGREDFPWRIFLLDIVKRAHGAFLRSRSRISAPPGSGSLLETHLGTFHSIN